MNHSPKTWLNRLNQVFDRILFGSGPQKRLRFASGSSNATDSADQLLLRRRLRAATLMLAIAKLCFTIRAITLLDKLNVTDFVILAVFCCICVTLYSGIEVTIRVLRILEAVVFIGLAMQLAMLMHSSLSEIASRDLGGDHRVRAAVDFVQAVKDQIFASFALMIVYGMFIPNTTRRAAVMVFAIALIPIVLILLTESSSGAINEFRRENVFSVGLASGNLLCLAVGAGFAIYSNHIMNRWRSRALEAEKMGQYELFQKIGSGGMGDVYLAEHRLLKRQCAVKVIRSELSEDPVVLAGFEREVKATATLSHWNTIQVFDYGQTAEGTFFYVMEYLEGMNLKQMVDKFGPLSDARAVFLLKHVCEALREASSCGLVHRDVKPSNIYLATLGNRNDVVKLLDFGLVRPVESDAESEDREPSQADGAQAVNGSPRYLCPEQAQGIAPDSRGDIYSLGATAYFLLTGHPPFQSEDVLQLVMSHATKQAPEFDRSKVTASTELETIVMKCLQKNPAARYQDFDELLDALNGVVIDSPWSWQQAEEWWKQSLTAESNVEEDPSMLDATMIATKTEIDS